MATEYTEDSLTNMKKQIQKSRSRKTQTKAPVMSPLAHLFMEKDTWIGLGVIILFFAVVLISVKSYVKTHNTQSVIYKLVSSSSTKKPSTIKENAVQQVKPSATPTPSVKRETVRENDNFWKITERACGTGVYYLSVQQRNGYGPEQSLHVGDVVTVECMF